jgi:hypothetical protein
LSASAEDAKSSNSNLLTFRAVANLQQKLKGNLLNVCKCLHKNRYSTEKEGKHLYKFILRRTYTCEQVFY